MNAGYRYSLSFHLEETWSGLLPMDIGLKFTNVTVQIVGIMKFIFLEVAKVMSIHIPFGRTQSALWCVLGIELRGCRQKEVAVGIIADTFPMECLELVSLVLDLPELLFRVDSILEHMHLLFRAKVRCHID